ncbi:hypothetical protein ATCC90586_008647 [Pythium insidiosum]|nr:hypothetical protein ATCC90586_008647 [Pythium insidiosum]
MPKPPSKSRAEFVLASPQPGYKDNNNPPVRCIHCMEAYRQLNIIPTKVKVVVGRAHKLDEHLASCQHAAKAGVAVKRQQTLITVGDASTVSSEQLLEWLDNLVAENNLAMSVIDSKSMHSLLHELVLASPQPGYKDNNNPPVRLVVHALVVLVLVLGSLQPSEPYHLSQKHR